MQRATDTTHASAGAQAQRSLLRCANRTARIVNRQHQYLWSSARGWIATQLRAVANTLDDPTETVEQSIDATQSMQASMHAMLNVLSRGASWQDASVFPRSNTHTGSDVLTQQFTGEEGESYAHSLS